MLVLNLYDKCHVLRAFRLFFNIDSIILEINLHQINFNY